MRVFTVIDSSIVVCLSFFVALFESYLGPMVKAMKNNRETIYFSNLKGCFKMLVMQVESCNRSKNSYLLTKGRSPEIYRSRFLKCVMFLYLVKRVDFESSLDPDHELTSF